MKSNFVPSKDSDEKQVMNPEKDKAEIMIGNNTKEFSRERFNCLLYRYKIDIEESTKGSNFAFDHVDELHNEFNRICLNRGGSYIDSPKWIKNKKTTLNPENSR